MTTEPQDHRAVNIVALISCLGYSDLNYEYCNRRGCYIFTWHNLHHNPPSQLSMQFLPGQNVNKTFWAPKFSWEETLANIPESVISSREVRKLYTKLENGMYDFHAAARNCQAAPL